MPTLHDPAFHEYIVLLKRRAGLSGFEMAVFIGLAKSTLESWLRGSTPHRYTRDQVEPGLRALEKELARQTRRLPPPLKIRQKDRLAYVKRIRSQHR
jgi:hypothetical protein